MDNHQIPIKITVTIKTLWLALRFNCKLSFAVRNQFSQILTATDSTYPLVRGKAQVNDSLVFYVPLEWVTTQKQFKLSVIMSSANGIVPAGHVTFTIPTPATNTQNSFTMPLQRCEDSHSQISFTIACEGSCPDKQISHFHSRLDSGRQKSSKKPEARFQGYDLNYEKIGSLNRQSYSASKLRNIEFGRGRHSRVPKFTSPYKADQTQSGGDVSNEQLLKEHQDYWLQIVKLEGVVDSMKNQINILKEENQQLVEENQNRRLEEEKIHALINENQINSSTIQQLQTLNHHYKSELQDKLAEISRIQEQLKAQSESHLHTKKQFQEILKEQHEKAISLTTRSGELQQQTKILKIGLLQQKKLKENFQNKLQSTVTDLRKKVEQIDDLKNQVQILKQEISFMRANSKDELVRQLSAQLQYSRSSYELQVKINKQQQEEMAKLKDCLAQASQTVKATEKLVEEQKHIAEEQVKKRKLNQQKAQQILEEQLHHFEKEKQAHLQKMHELKSKEIILSEELKMATLQIQEEKEKMNKIKEQVQFQCQQKIQKICKQNYEQLKKKQQQYQTLKLNYEKLQSDKSQLDKQWIDQQLQLKTVNDHFEALQQEFQLTLLALNKQKEQGQAKDKSIRQLLTAKTTLEQQYEQLEKERNSSVLQLESRLNEEKYSHNYSASMTLMNLELARLEKQNSQLKLQLEALTTSKSQKQIKLEKQLGDVKNFAQGRLQEIVMLRRQSSQLKAKLDTRT